MNSGDKAVDATYSRTRYALLVRNGLCTRCKAQVHKSFKLCEPCLKADREEARWPANRARHRRQSKEYRDRKKRFSK